MNNPVIRQLKCFLFIGMLSVLTSCSSQEPRSNLDTLLCWLRPSCVPSHESDPPSVPPRQVKATPSPQPIQVQQSPKLPAAQTPPPCRTTLKTTVTSQNPSVTISYLEPTTQADGSPLANLAKTTIYHDRGKGFIKTKDVPATNPKGGGKITETLSIAVGNKEAIETTICVTSTNSFGQEG